MKFHKRLAILALSIISVLTISTATVFAEEDYTVDNGSSYIDDIYTPEEPDDNYTTDDPYDEPEPDYGDTSSVDNTTGSGDSGYYGDDDYNYNSGSDDYYTDDNYNTNDYSSYDTYSRSSFVVDRENEFYQPGTRAEGSTQPVVDNKLYDADLTDDTNEMNADDWNIALSFDDTNSGNDFNFIKNNNSEDDSVLYQLMLFGGVLLITISIFGVLLIIILTVKTSKKNKAILAKADASKKRNTKSAKKNELSLEDPDEDISKYNTSEIDLSKYDKYL